MRLLFFILQSSSLALTYFFLLFSFASIYHCCRVLCRWRNRKRVKKKKKKNSFRCLHPIGDKHQWRATEELSLLYHKRNTKTTKKLSYYLFISFCLLLSKFQHVFTQFDTTRARPHFVKSSVYVACLTTIINVHSPNGTCSLGFFVARKVTVIGQKVN